NPSISVVVYMSTEGRDDVDHVLETALEAARSATHAHEVVFVTDDPAVADMRNLEAPAIRTLQLARLHSIDAALMAGAEHARGDLIFFTGHRPDRALGLLPDFLLSLEDSVDWVYGVRFGGRGVDRIRRHVTARLAEFCGLEDDGCRLARVLLARRSTVRAALARADDDYDLDRLFADLGFTSQAIPCAVRDDDDTRGLQRTLVLGLTSSPRALQVVAAIGTLAFVMATTTMSWAVARKLMGGTTVPGYTSLLASIWLLGGASLAGLGLVGVYLARILLEVRRGPDVVVRTIHRVGDSRSHGTRHAEVAPRGRVEIET
ncbi:MAG TPA: hypothetical protein VKA86_07805, partial [Candidatus Krumholzibacteria bacterium]|nr:hypothetical protein [Candidatus Krumholzibacteria bacterium]